MSTEHGMKLTPEPWFGFTCQMQTLLEHPRRLDPVSRDRDQLGGIEPDDKIMFIYLCCMSCLMPEILFNYVFSVVISRTLRQCFSICVYNYILFLCIDLCPKLGCS